MALRNLVAACCRSGAGTPAAAAVPSPRFLATVRNLQVKQHSHGTRKETSDEKAFLNKVLDKVVEDLRQRDKDFEKLGGEMKRVLKICGVSWVGITAYSVFRSWSLEKSTQPAAAQGTSQFP